MFWDIFLINLISNFGMVLFGYLMGCQTGKNIALKAYQVKAQAEVDTHWREMQKSERGQRVDLLP